MSTNNTATIILAAGLGTRMRSKRAKVLHEVGGEPMIVRVLRQIGAAGKGSPIVVVVGCQAREVESVVRNSFPDSQIRFALQSEQRGTGDAGQYRG